jgi:hypothetical protein
MNMVFKGLSVEKEAGYSVHPISLAEERLTGE